MGRWGENASIRVVLCVAWLAIGLLALGDRLTPLWRPVADYQIELQNGTVRMLSTAMAPRDLEATVAVALLDDIERLVKQARYDEADIARFSFRRSQREIITLLQARDRDRMLTAYAAAAAILGPAMLLLLLGPLAGIVRMAHRGVTRRLAREES
jgi:hypothetical protein